MSWERGVEHWLEEFKECFDGDWTTEIEEAKTHIEHCRSIARIYGLRTWDVMLKSDELKGKCVKAYYKSRYDRGLPIAGHRNNFKKAA